MKPVSLTLLIAASAFAFASPAHALDDDRVGADNASTGGATLDQNTGSINTGTGTGVGTRLNNQNTDVNDNSIVTTGGGASTTGASPDRTRTGASASGTATGTVNTPVNAGSRITGGATTGSTRDGDTPAVSD